MKWNLFYCMLLPVRLQSKWRCLLWLNVVTHFWSYGRRACIFRIWFVEYMQDSMCADGSQWSKKGEMNRLLVFFFVLSLLYSEWTNAWITRRGENNGTLCPGQSMPFTHHPMSIYLILAKISALSFIGGGFLKRFITFLYGTVYVRWMLNWACK